jgi:hypothetical protein
MTAELSPRAVAARLGRLRAICRPMTEAEARALLEPTRPTALAAPQVASRLAELRALLELTRYLHRGRLRPEADR